MQAAEKSGELDAHASSYRYFSQDEDRDFHFGNLILGASVNQGCSVGEAFYAASKIKDEDAKTWHKAWFDLAGLVRSRGEKAFAKGRDISARSQFLRGSQLLPHILPGHDSLGSPFFGKRAKMPSAEEIIGASFRSPPGIL